MRTYTMRYWYLLFLLFITCIVSSVACGQSNSIAIADWDIVPYQTFESEINVGVLAFHAQGIKRVDFYINQVLYKSISSPSYNPQSKVNEFWVPIKSDSCGCRQIAISATAFPNSGIEKVLKPLLLYPNPNKNYYRSKEVFVSNSGNDQPTAGTQMQPFKTIAYALSQSEEGATITLSTAGSYEVSFLGKRLKTKFWTTIRGAQNLKKEDIVLTQPAPQLLRLKHDKIKLENLTVDFASVQTIYPENDQSIWFDNVRWTDSNYKVNDKNGPLNYKIHFNPVRTSRDIEGYYVTDSTAENMLSGFVDAKLARNIRIKNILGDALTNNKLTANAEVSHIWGNETGKHSDIFQVFGRQDNLILYNLLGYQIGGTAYRAKYGKVTNDGVQNIFLGTINSELSNIAVVNVCIQNEQLPHMAPFSQLSSKQSNVLIQNVTTLNQDWKMRPDALGTRKFEPSNVVIKDSRLPGLLYSGLKHDERVSFTADQVSVVNTDTNFTTSNMNYCKSQNILER